MKSETVQTYKSTRWIIFYVSLAMMAVGWFAGHGFDYLSAHFPQRGPPDNMYGGRFDQETFLCIFLFLAGMLLFVSWCLYMVAAIIISLFRRKHPKLF
jgi:hypothetical protein